MEKKPKKQPRAIKVTLSKLKQPLPMGEELTVTAREEKSDGWGLRHGTYNPQAACSAGARGRAGAAVFQKTQRSRSFNTCELGVLNQAELCAFHLFTADIKKYENHPGVSTHCLFLSNIRIPYCFSSTSLLSA